MQRINLNDARTSCNRFTANAINLGTMRVKLQRAQYKYTLVYVVAALLNIVVTQDTCILYTLSVQNGRHFLC
jgi:hypothetical protein